MHGATPEDIEFRDGGIFLRSSAQKSEKFAELLARHGNQPVEGAAEVKPDLNEKEFSAHSFGAVFAEVSVDPDLGMTHVRRVVAVDDVGKQMNQRLAKSQFIGGSSGASASHCTNTATWARGIGEIGITGTGAAVANAIYHATGKRVR